ncbi:MAG: YjzD family protein [Bacillota bacterium]|nr:YjzD family protein [Bacillota bacterium]
MKYFWAFFWTFLLVEMLTYVVSSMLGAAFNFKTGAFLAVCVTVLLMIISTVIPNEPAEKHIH